MSSDRSTRYRPGTSKTTTAASTTVASPSRKSARKVSNIDSILFLKQNHAQFNSPSKRESVFFDECNRDLISLTSNYEQTNRTRVVFQNTDNVDRIEFILPVEKRILSIKLNSSRTVLAYHVERNIVELINVLEKVEPDGRVTRCLDNKRYVQSTRTRNSKLIGFLWTNPLNLVMITDLSVEYYHVEPHRSRLTHIKMFQSSTNWFVYQPAIGLDQTSDKEDIYSILMVSTGSLGNTMQPYMFTNGRIVRLHKFEVEGNWHNSDRLELFERSITIAYIYGFVRLLVLQHECLNVRSHGAQIVLYTINPHSGSTSITHTLDLDVSGRFAINILDNLIIAHDQPSRTSFVFDIMVDSTEKSDCSGHFVSFIGSRPIRKLELDGERAVDMYSLNWVFFQPNFIVDAKLGLLTTLELDLTILQNVVQDNNMQLSFLKHRKNSDKIIMKCCKSILDDSLGRMRNTSTSSLSVNPLADVSSAFDILSSVIISASELNKPPQSSKSQIYGSETGGISSLEHINYCSPIEPHLYQEDFHREVFRNFEDIDLETAAHAHFTISALVEFIFAIRRQSKNVEFCIYELLVRCLLNSRQYFQMIQMIRSEIFEDSKQLACLLLSMKDKYAPAKQIGLDMFHRLPGGLPANMPSEILQD